MSLRPFTLLEPAAALTPLVVDSPHSGCSYPPDFHFACPLPLLRQTEDFAVDRLVDCAAEAGAAVLKAEFPRSYIDANRAEDDLDPAVLAEAWPTPLAPCDRTLLGLGLVRRLCKSGVPVYKDPLPLADVRYRVEHYYRPYHAKLKRRWRGVWLFSANVISSTRIPCRAAAMKGVTAETRIFRARISFSAIVRVRAVIRLHAPRA